MTFADVAVLHSGLPSKVLLLLIVAWALSNRDTISIKVHNGSFWACTTLNATFGAVISVAKRSTRSSAALSTLSENHTMRTLDVTLSAVLSPSINNNTVLGTSTAVVGKNCASALLFSSLAVVLHAKSVISFVINDLVTLNELSRQD